MSSKPYRAPSEDAGALRALEHAREMAGLEAERQKESGANMLELGRLLSQIRDQRYWRAENFSSFRQFLERSIPLARRTCYDAITINDHLPAEVRGRAVALGWAKALTLAVAARAYKEAFNLELWLERAQALSKRELQKQISAEFRENAAPTSSHGATLRVGSEDLEVVQHALSLASQVAHEEGREIVSNDEALVELARQFILLRTRQSRNCREGTGPRRRISSPRENPSE